MQKMKLVVFGNGIAESTQSRGPAYFAGMRPVRCGDDDVACYLRSARAAN